MRKITRLRIRDYRGISAMDVEAGETNLFAGLNAQGKTSVLDAIAAVFKGKEPTTAVRHDTERAELLVELDDGTEVLRRIPAAGKPGKQTVRVRRDNATLSSPQKWLDSLFSSEGMNPVDFIKSKDRQKRLLEALPVTTTPAEVVEYLEGVGLSKDDVKGLRTESAHAFEVFTAVAKMLADDRKAANAQVKQATQWIAQEMEEMDGIVDPSDEIEAVTTELAEARAATGAAAEMEARRQNLETKRAGVLESLEEARHRVADLEKQAEELVEELAGLDATGDDPKHEVDPNLVPELDAKLAELKENKGRWDEAQKRAGRVEARQEQVEDLQARAKALDAGVKLFQKQAPAEALAKTELPVEGLEYKDGAFFVHGTHIDQLSGAETVRVAVQFTLERVRQKGLHVVCVDGMETLDNEQRQAFFGEMAGSGVQLWATEVNHGSGRGAPDGDGVLYVVMQDGEPTGLQSTIPEESAPESGLPGLEF